MPTFIIKNRFKEKLGQAIFSDGKFKMKITPPKDRKLLTKLLDKFSKEGIRYLGEVILDNPIKPSGPLFLIAVKNQLARRGYIMIEKKK